MVMSAGSGSESATKIRYEMNSKRLAEKYLDSGKKYEHKS